MNTWNKSTSLFSRAYCFTLEFSEELKNVEEWCQALELFASWIHDSFKPSRNPRSRSNFSIIRTLFTAIIHVIKWCTADLHPVRNAVHTLCIPQPHNTSCVIRQRWGALVTPRPITPNWFWKTSCHPSSLSVSLTESLLVLLLRPSHEQLSRTTEGWNIFYHFIAVLTQQGPEKRVSSLCFSYVYSRHKWKLHYATCMNASRRHLLTPPLQLLSSARVFPPKIIHFICECAVGKGGRGRVADSPAQWFSHSLYNVIQPLLPQSEGQPVQSPHAIITLICHVALQHVACCGCRKNKSCTALSKAETPA